MRSSLEIIRSNEFTLCTNVRTLVLIVHRNVNLDKYSQCEFIEMKVENDHDDKWTNVKYSHVSSICIYYQYLCTSSRNYRRQNKIKRTTRFYQE